MNLSSYFYFITAINYFLTLLATTCMAATIPSTDPHEGLLSIAEGKLTAISFAGRHPSGQSHCHLKSTVVGGDQVVGAQPFRHAKSFVVCIPRGRDHFEEGRLCRVVIDELTITSQGGTMDYAQLEKDREAAMAAAAAAAGRGEADTKKTKAKGGKLRRISTYGWRGRVRVQCVASKEGGSSSSPKPIGSGLLISVTNVLLLSWVLRPLLMFHYY